MEKYNRMREGPPSWETQPSQIPHRPPQGKLNGGGGLERARSRSQKTRLNKIVLPPLGGGGGPAPIGSKPMMSATVSRAGGLDSMAEESQSHGAMPMPPMAPLAPPHMPPMSGGDSHHRSGGRKHKHKHQAVASPVEGASYEGGGADAAGGAAADPEAAQEYTEVLRRYRQGTAEGDPNSQNNLAPRRTAMDNLAIGNWHDSGRRTGAWTPYLNNREVDTVLVAKGAWPDAAKAVIAHAGIEPEKP